MEPVNEIINNSQKYINFIKTVFGWIHKDWISDAFKMKYISGNDPMTYKLVIPFKKKTVTERIGRAKWTSEEEKMSADEDYFIKNNKGKLILPFFKWLEGKRETNTINI